jgi:hypothetical protein
VARTKQVMSGYTRVGSREGGLRLSSVFQRSNKKCMKGEETNQCAKASSDF